MDVWKQFQEFLQRKHMKGVGVILASCREEHVQSVNCMQYEKGFSANEQVHIVIHNTSVNQQPPPHTHTLHTWPLRCWFQKYLCSIGYACEGISSVIDNTKLVDCTTSCILYALQWGMQLLTILHTTLNLASLTNSLKWMLWWQVINSANVLNQMKRSLYIFACLRILKGLWNTYKIWCHAPLTYWKFWVWANVITVYVWRFMRTRCLYSYWLCSLHCAHWLHCCLLMLVVN